jgi:hypothetical protein
MSAFTHRFIYIRSFNLEPSEEALVVNLTVIARVFCTMDLRHLHQLNRAYLFLLRRSSDSGEIQGLKRQIQRFCEHMQGNYTQFLAIALC